MDSSPHQSHPLNIASAQAQSPATTASSTTFASRDDHTQIESEHPDVNLHDPKQLEAEIQRAKSLIRTIPDHPEPGVQFRDITSLLVDGRAFKACIQGILQPVVGTFDVVAGIEARGFFLAGAVGVAAEAGIIPLRKNGKLPRPVGRVDYNLEYGQDSLEVSEDLTPGMKVFLVDDILATGGSLAAGRKLIEMAGAEVVATAVLMELEGLGGREQVPQCHALFRM